MGEWEGAVEFDRLQAAAAGSSTSRRVVICPVLVGRDAPALRLRGFVDAALAGQRRLALVAGEAGLGKSRLVAATAAYARDRGFQVFAGASFPRDRACPFGPVVELLRAGLDRLSPDDVPSLVRPFARELAPLLPELAPVLGGAVAAASEPHVDRERRQLFAALAHCLLGPATEQAPASPICLVVEDLHWCDDVSLDFLDFLARGLGRGASRQPLLVLATYRAEDAEAGLRGWLGQMDRARLADEVSLSPLSRDETHQMLAATFAGGPLPLGMVDAIHELAEGNPFRIEELLGALVAAGEIVDHDGSWRWSGRPVNAWKLPRSLYEAVQERVVRLSGSARELLTLASLVGRRFDFELLQQMAQVDERTLLVLLKELVAAGLVVEESGDRFAFRHALTRQAVYSELFARERIALHRTVGEMAEQLYAGSLDRHLGDLAYHFAEAGSWEKALTYARRAADHARRLYAPRAMVEQLSRAIEACGQLPGDRSDMLADLHLERARASDTVGDVGAAIADAHAAIELAQRAGSRRVEWQALLDLGLFWAGRDYTQALPSLEAALALARGLDDPSLLGHSLNRLGNWRANTEQPRQALPLHREALAIFEQLGDRAGIAETVDLLGMVALLSADLAGAIDYYARAAALMEELDDRPGLVTCLAVLVSRGGCYELDSAATDAADFALGLRDGERAIQIAREIGWPAGESFALTQTATVLGLLGEYRRALEYAERALTIARNIGHLQWEVGALVILGALSLDLLCYERARAHFERALELAREIRSTYWIQQVIGVLARTYVHGARSAAGQVAAERLAHAAALLGEVPAGREPVSALGERATVFGQADLALARSDWDQALTLFARVTAPSINAHDTAAGPPATGQAEASLAALSPSPALGRAAALAGLGRYQEAEALLHSTREIVVRQGCRPLIWRCDLALGDLYSALGRADDAQQAYLAARQAVEELAASLPEPELRDELLRQMLALLPRALRPAARQAQTGARPGGLTAREREVALQIAAGHTNREIAEVLVLGERTVETHVSNILGKLALTSRREVARWVAVHGL